MNIKQILLLTAMVAAFLAIPGVRMAICSIPINDVLQGAAYGFGTLYAMATEGRLSIPPFGSPLGVVLSWATTCAVFLLAAFYGVAWSLLFILVNCGRKE